MGKLKFNIAKDACSNNKVENKTILFKNITSNLKKKKKHVLFEPRYYVILDVQQINGLSYRQFANNYYTINYLKYKVSPYTKNSQKKLSCHKKLWQIKHETSANNSYIYFVEAMTLYFERDQCENTIVKCNVYCIATLYISIITESYIYCNSI